MRGSKLTTLQRSVVGNASCDAAKLLTLFDWTAPTRHDEDTITRMTGWSSKRVRLALDALAHVELILKSSDGRYGRPDIL